MPGYAIHIAIAKEYMKKHPNQIKDSKEFLTGTISPDISKNKNESHYGNWENYQIDIFLDRFINDEKVELENDFWKGYFLHLYVDKMFSNEYFYEEFLEIKRKKDTFYQDYDKLNEKIFKDYDIKKEDCSNEVNEKINFIDGKPKYLKYPKIKKMIKDISEIDIDEEINKIKKEGSL